MNLIDALENATEEDLKNIQDEIRSCKTRLSSLRYLEKFLLMKFKRSSKISNNDEIFKRSTKLNGSISKSEDKLNKILLYLYSSGPKTKKQISESTSVNMIGGYNVSAIVNNKFFHVNSDDLVSLTSEGENKARILSNNK